MATVSSDAVARDESTFRPFPSGQIGHRKATISITKTQMETAAEVMQMVPVFKGETVLGVILSGGVLSAGADIAVDVGDASDDNRFISADVTFRSGGAAFVNAVGTFVPYTYTADDTIDITWQTAATTGSTGPVTLTMHVLVV